jgi:hypothetical protein
MRPSSLTHDQQIAADSAWLERRAREVASKPVARRPACETCAAFTADTINPSAGMGSCRHGHSVVYPGQRRLCADFHRAKQEPSA